MAKDKAYADIKTALDTIANEVKKDTPASEVILTNAQAARDALAEMDPVTKEKAETSFLRALKSIDPFLRVVPNQPTDYGVLANRIIECQVMLERLYASDDSMSYWRSTEC